MKPRFRTAAVIPALLLTVGLAHAQILTTYAGSDALFTAAGQPATAVQFAQPAGLAIDKAGNVYIAATGQSMILKVAPNGIISVAAGDGLARYSGDGGSAASASLSSMLNGLPNGLALDAAGNLYIADQANCVIRKVAPNGIITTVAGNGATGFSGDGGPATKAQLFQPSGIAVDSAGNLYVADTENYRIRMVTPGGVISTLAGTGASGYSGDNGPAVKALLHQPTALALDASGNLYIADTNNFAVRKVTPAGIITTIAGTGKAGFAGDTGPATQALLNQPMDVKFDSAGNLYIADYRNQRIRRVDPAGIITTIAGTGQTGSSGDAGPATAAQLNGPVQLAIDATGALLIADLHNNCVRRIAPSGAIDAFAGQPLSIGDGGPSTQARLTNPFNVALDSAGNLYIADTGQNRIRKVTPSGTITTLAGTGAQAESGDNGPATSASLSVPYGVATDAAGNVYIADSANTVIRKITNATGVISVIAGNGACCYTGPNTDGDGGPATAATLFYPRAVAVDAAGNVYFEESIVGANGIGNSISIHRIAPDGKIALYAGGSLTAGFAGDGLPATQAQFGNYVMSIAAASDGALYIADAANNRIRKIDPVTQIVTTVAGPTGLSFPTAVAVDKSGNLYIGGSGYVRKATPAGVISPLAGNGQFSFSGDGGAATAGSFSSIAGLAVDAAGNVYVSDEANNRIRVIQPAAGTLAVSPSSLTFDSSSPTTQSFTVTATGSGTLAWAASAATSAGGAWLVVTPATGASAAGQSGATVTVTVKPTGLSAGDYYGQIQITSPAAGSPVQIVTVRLTVTTAGDAPPSVADGGVLNTASYSLQTPVAPGTMVSIFGANLTAAGQVYQADGYPLPTQLGGTSVTIGGELVPLVVVTPGQINAVLPFDIPVDTTLPLVVTYNNAISAPVAVATVASQPGIFTAAQNGQGLAIVVIAHSDGTEVIAGPGNAAAAGNVLVVYCTGLGDVTPRGVAGSPAPLTPTSIVIDPVTATLGGVKATVLFAGSTPGFTGLYQVNLLVPQGIAATSAAPLILTQSARSSPAAVTIPVQ